MGFLPDASLVLFLKAVYSQKTCTHQGIVYRSQGKSLSYYWEGSLLASDCHQMGICIFLNIVSPTFESLWLLEVMCEDIKQCELELRRGETSCACQYHLFLGSLKIMSRPNEKASILELGIMVSELRIFVLNLDYILSRWVGCSTIIWKEEKRVACATGREVFIDFCSVKNGYVDIYRQILLRSLFYLAFSLKSGYETSSSSFLKRFCIRMW